MQRAHQKGIHLEILLPREMAEVDRLSIERGPHDGYGLMRNAGAALAAEILSRYPDAAVFDVLCGPGNNGGDGYVVARLLHEAGATVSLWADGEPRPGSNAAIAARDCPLEASALENFRPGENVVVDALYGAGLSRPLNCEAARVADACRDAGSTVVAVDLPSGVSGESGMAQGPAFEAELTVTFFRLKPGHLLEPGRAHCGEVIVADIGISDTVIADTRSSAFINMPAMWATRFPRPDRAQHKYSRGHAAVFSGGLSWSGAGRLSAIAAARVGAGAVTLLSPASAIIANAAHLTSIMLRKVDDAHDLASVLSERQPDAFVLGPGFGLNRPIMDIAVAILAQAGRGALVLDADALTAFRDEPHSLFAAIGQSGMEVVLTPHEGEFARLFPDLAADRLLSKLDRARMAAARAGAVVVYKGPDTVIAAPYGRVAINANGSPWLATAGSGDVLAGFIAGLAAQKMPAFEAACAAVWLHAEAATRHGPGLIAEDLPGLLPPLLRELL